ncbi:MAG: hypothetical protein AB7U82_35270 [Blastocatellales bacterium]
MLTCADTRVYRKCPDISFLTLKLKNVGDQPIISYHIDLKSKTGLTPDLMGGDPLAPGTELAMRLPLAGVPRDPQTGRYRLNVAMALFTDGSAEGDWNKSQTQREKFEGAAMALERIGQKLRNIEQAQASRLYGELGEFRPPTTLSKSQQAGYAHAVKQARLKLYLIEHDSATGKIPSDLQRSFERQVAKIRMFNPERREQ